MTIKWHKNKQKLNINDIIKVIDILPCSWEEGYSAYTATGKLIPTPHLDGKNFIYAVSDSSDGYVVMYYKCNSDGTIIQIGAADYSDE